MTDIIVKPGKVVDVIRAVLALAVGRISFLLDSSLFWYYAKTDDLKHRI